jgi:quercetin dioxygenase-like cupin family protein
MEQGIADGSLEAAEAPLEHYRAGALYGRRIYVKPDTAIITKVHKTEHFTIALKGHCTVYDQNGDTYDVVAPQVFVTQPGTWRAIYAHDEVEWFTAHLCFETGQEAIDRYLACDSMEEYNALQLENKT